MKYLSVNTRWLATLSFFCSLSIMSSSLHAADRKDVIAGVLVGATAGYILAEQHRPAHQQEYRTDVHRDVYVDIRTDRDFDHHSHQRHCGHFSKHYRNNWQRHASWKRYAYGHYDKPRHHHSHHNDYRGDWSDRRH